MHLEHAALGRSRADGSDVGFVFTERLVPLRQPTLELVERRPDRRAFVAVSPGQRVRQLSQRVDERVVLSSGRHGQDDEDEGEVRDPPEHAASWLRGFYRFLTRPLTAFARAA